MKVVEKISLLDWDFLSEQESARLYGGSDPFRNDSTSVATDSISVSRPKTSHTISMSTSYNGSNNTTSTSIGYSGSYGNWGWSVSGSVNLNTGSTSGSFTIKKSF